ncbi:acyltransferase [uncultured Eubacterium sp.]|uniref:acyltransferase n=1 Tax=uncultured Eubacterium sp. TaxID=165185 RepID=UPI003262EF4C
MFFRFWTKWISLMRILFIRLENTNRISIGRGFSLRKGVIFRIKKSGKITIGNNVFFNNYCTISSIGQITIGNDCIFGEGVRIYDHNHKYQHPDIPIHEQGYKVKSVTVGDNCWVGSNVVILPGATIGNNSVIGAGVVVYGSIPADSIVKNIQELRIDKIERGSYSAE